MPTNTKNIDVLKLITYEDAFEMISNWSKEQLVATHISFDKSGKIPFFIQYLNYLSKSITLKSRKVSKAKNFEVSFENQEGFNKLVNSIKLGLDVNLYLSKKVLNAKIVDGMLDNFGIKHFHLGNDIEAGFFKRTGEIALAIVTDYEVFFITSKQHGKGYGHIWYEKDVIEIIHKERPDLIEHCKVAMFEELTNNISETSDIKTLRDKNANTAITLDDGTSYLPFNLGQSLAGFPMMSSLKMINVVQNLQSLVNNVIKEQIDISFQIKSCEISQLNFLADGKPHFLELKLSDGKTNKYLEFYNQQVSVLAKS